MRRRDFRKRLAVSGSALSHRRSPLLDGRASSPRPLPLPSGSLSASVMYWKPRTAHFINYDRWVLFCCSHIVFFSSFVALETLLFIGTSCIAIFCKMALVVFAVSIFYHDDQRWVDWLVDQDGNVIYGGHVIVRSDG